jgi:hypothetical protein
MSSETGIALHNSTVVSMCSARSTILTAEYILRQVLGTYATCYAYSTAPLCRLESTV